MRPLDRLGRSVDESKEHHDSLFLGITVIRACLAPGSSSFRDTQDLMNAVLHYDGDFTAEGFGPG
jgi:hypothetical protein